MEHATQHKGANLFFAIRLLLLASTVVFLVAALASWAAGLPVRAAPAKAHAAAPAASTSKPPMASGTPSPPANPESAAVAALPDISSHQAEGFSEIPSMATSEPATPPDPGACIEDVQFLADLTVPDGTVLEPNEVFTKTWRVRNAGSCDWAGYRLVFAGGEPMGAEGPQPNVGQPVFPSGSRSQILPHTPAGEDLDISVEMVALGEPGDYTGYWHIQAPGGAVLGRLTCVIAVAGADGDVAVDNRWIDVDLSQQLLTAYEGGKPVHTTLVSSGLPATPTPMGQFRIWIKFRYDDMAGDGYYIEDVPYVMYFHEGYGLHGVTWHGNFGHPMSHGCVNLPTSEAEWLFNWADVGTLVKIHDGAVTS